MTLKKEENFPSVRKKKTLQHRLLLKQQASYSQPIFSFIVNKHFTVLKPLAYVKHPCIGFIVGCIICFRFKDSITYGLQNAWRTNHCVQSWCQLVCWCGVAVLSQSRAAQCWLSFLRFIYLIFFLSCGFKRGSAPWACLALGTRKGC